MNENVNKDVKIVKKIPLVAIVVVLISLIGVIIVTVVLINNKDKIRQIEEKVSIKEIETKQIKLVDYDGGNFTMKIPEGWAVTTGGTQMYYTIRVQDPKDERNQIFVALKAAPFLKNAESKKLNASYVKATGNTNNNNVLSQAVILNPATVKNFYENFNNYTEYAKKYETTYSNYQFPSINVFTQIEEFESNTYMKSDSKDDKTIRAVYEDTQGRPAEGLFMATILDFGELYKKNSDTSVYSVYNVIFITSAKDEFVNYENILTQSLNSLKYKDSFIDETNATIKEKTDETLKPNASIQAAYDSYNSAWNAREKNYDIVNQKYSDSILGYERVYDTETGKIYKAYNGFTNEYTGKKYKTVVDSMYTEHVTGYIEKSNAK